MKQWVSCFTILLGLVLSICPIKSYAFSTAYGEAYIDLSSLNISAEGDVEYDSSLNGYLDANVSDGTNWTSDDRPVYDYDSLTVSAELPNAKAQATLDYNYFKGTVNVNSDGIREADSYSYGAVGYNIYAPEDGQGGWVTASLDYELILNLSTTSIGELSGGYARVSLDLNDDNCGTHDGFLIDRTARDGDEIYVNYPGTLEIYYFLSPGSYANLSMALETSVGITSPVPIPSTILLLGSGMLWMVGYRRKCLTQKP